MTRRFIRLGIQLTAALLFLIIFIFLVDNRYRVLPVRLHEWSPIHHPGHVVTDITITSCSTINLLGSCVMGGEWRRVEKDLYLGKGWLTQAYLHVQRKKEGDLTEKDRIVLDVHVGRLAPGAEKQGKNDQWESRPGGLWVLRSSSHSAFDDVETVTAVDVLFGADAADPRPGWTLKQQAILIDGGTNAPEPRLSVRKGPPQRSERPTIRMNKDGKFKIMQVSDMHISTGLGKCRDEYPVTSHCDADPRTLDFIGAMLDLEVPDLVILSGDQVNGETSPDAQTALLKVIDIFIDREIPYAMIFGNHDDEGSLSRAALMQLVEKMPWSLSMSGPATVDGVGNYYIEVFAKGTSSHSAITLYLLDTHAYSPDEAHYKGYDWLKPAQLAWFRETAASLRSSASHKDYAHHHLNMAFIHIPLPEYREVGNIIEGSGEFREPPTAPGFNAGFKDALVENGIMAVSCGHDHVNDYCALARHSAPDAIPPERGAEARRLAKDGALWMCYAGGSGYGGYAGYGGFRRRLKLWEFEMRGTVTTWSRVDGDAGKHNYKHVVQNGRVVTTGGN